MKVSKYAFWAWIGIQVVANFIIILEELGIQHKFGLIPITWDAVDNPLLAVDIAMGGLTFTAWWLVHWYRRKYGDLSK